MAEALKCYDSLPSPALELVFEKLLNKDCRRSVGSFLVCCKNFYEQFLATHAVPAYQSPACPQGNQPQVVL
jgi:hypothetical protein